MQKGEVHETTRCLSIIDFFPLLKNMMQLSASEKNLLAEKIYCWAANGSFMLCIVCRKMEVKMPPSSANFFHTL